MIIPNNKTSYKFTIRTNKDLNILLYTTVLRELCGKKNDTNPKTNSSSIILYQYYFLTLCMRATYSHVVNHLRIN